MCTASYVDRATSARRTGINFLPQSGVRTSLVVATRALDASPIALHAPHVLSLSSIGALAWLLAALAPSSIQASSSVASSSVASSARGAASSMGSSVHATPDVYHLVSAEGRAFATSPVEIPEAARAHGDASALDGHALGAATLPRTLDPITNGSFATRPTWAIAQTTSPRASACTPRSSRGPPSV
jgi:hypothetical protein